MGRGYTAISCSMEALVMAGALALVYATRLATDEASCKTYCLYLALDKRV